MLGPVCSMSCVGIEFLRKTLTQADTSACLSLRQPLSIDQHQPDLHSQSAWPLIPRGGSRSTLLCGGACYAEGPIPGMPSQAN